MTGIEFFKAQLKQLSVNKEKTINSGETLILKEIFVVVLGLPLINLKYGLTMDLKFENSFKYIGLQDFTLNGKILDCVHMLVLRIVK